MDSGRTQDPGDCFVGKVSLALRLGPSRLAHVEEGRLGYLNEPRGFITLAPAV